MNRHLVAISIGPVQEFIAAARRTRDLWFGSYLLSELSRAAAKSIEENQGMLIFPNSSTAPNVVNVILAELVDNDPKVVCQNAANAVQEQWQAFANQAYKDASQAICGETWNEQIHDVIEFQAAWLFYGATDSYKHARQHVMRLLNGRKKSRDFLPAVGHAGIPKSSLDGQRETVLKEGDRAGWPKTLRLSSGEQLDIVGVVKRLGKAPNEFARKYSSVTRIAVDPWLRGLKAEDRKELTNCCDQIPNIVRVHEECFHSFPFEGHVLFAQRHTDYAKENGLNEAALAPIATLLKKMSRPNPYLAVLVADGDKMGEVISNQNDIEEHRKFSGSLALFADQASTIVSKCNGILVYSGGDDVLAFLPVDQCLKCARCLRDHFVCTLQNYKTKEGKSPTLSVGVAIGHFMENLEDLLTYGRQAEKAAKKPNRDGLAVHLCKRGGPPVEIRHQWETQPDERIQNLADFLLQGAIPGKLAYDLQCMARLYAEWPTETVSSAIKVDLKRLIAKKTSRVLESVQETLAPYLEGMNSENLLIFANEILIAHQIATALGQSGATKL